MKWFKFGIQEKTALLVMAVAVMVALGTSLVLQRIAAQMVEKHELVDLDDEAHLRAWELTDRFNTLRDDVRALATDPSFRLLAWSDDVDAEKIAGAMGSVCRQWEHYLQAEIMEGVEAIAEASQLQEVQPPLTEDDLPVGTEILVSPIQRVQAGMEMPMPGDSMEVRRKWLTVVQASANIPPPPGMDVPPRTLSIVMRLEPFWSPRHLFFMVDLQEPGQPYVVHPNMSIQTGFQEEPLFQNNIRREFLQHREFQSMDPAVRINRVALLESQPLDPDYYFYFLEGTPKPELKFVLDMRRQTNPEDFDLFMDRLTGEHESMNRHLGGLGGRVGEVRMLARDPADLREGTAENPSFRDDVEIQLARYLGLPEDRSLIDWKSIVPCMHCHISCMEVTLDTSAGSRRYLLMYAAFQEEFVGAIQQEIRSSLTKWVVVFGLMALVVAFALALHFIQPLRQMTRTAQEVVAEKGALHERIAGLSANLPDDRRDEVGDIARASKRLFDEVIANQEHLERRVDERTAELRAANHQLEGLAREKDAFLANVSHELRTPMTAVSGNLQLLKRRALESRESRYVDRAMNGVKHLETLIDEILDFQKIIMGGITIEPEEFELRGLLNDLSDSLQFQAQKNRNRLEFEQDPGLDLVCTDRKRLRQILTNLVANACKFTHDGVVSLKAQPWQSEDSEEPWMEILIEDSGRGMNEEEQSRLFTRFYTNKKANETGAGLGLVICEELCVLMGGSVTLLRSIPGKGSTFAVRLPQRTKAGTCADSTIS